MKFNNLSHDEKLSVQKKVLEVLEKVGGKNHFLGMIEDIKNASQHPLMNKTGKYHFPNGTITWGKQVFKEKVLALKTMFIQHDDDNILNIKNIKLQKEIQNCIKTLGKLVFIIETKDGAKFEFKPFVTINETDIEIDPIFQVLFFDSINNTKRILDYK
jgi:hypothetical protein